MAKLEQAIENGEIEETSDGKFYCTVCDYTYQKGSIRKHLDTDKHQNNLSSNHGAHSTSRVSVRPKVRGQNNNGDENEDEVSTLMSNGKYFCKACKKEYAKGYIEDHLTTKKHLSNVQPAREGKNTLHNDKKNDGNKQRGRRPKPGIQYDTVNPVEKAFCDGILVEVEDENYPFWCEVCEQPLKIEGRLETHILSNKHNLKLSKYEREQEVDSEEYTSSDDDSDNDLEPEVKQAFDRKVLKRNPHNDSTYWCVPCKQELKIRGNLKRHISSNSHNSKLSARKAIGAHRNLNVDGNSRRTSPQDFDDAGTVDDMYKYNTYHKVKGHVHVFNVLKERNGAKSDSKNIENTFNRMGYRVFLHEDFSKDDMFSTVKGIKNDSCMKDVGSLIVFILCHGTGCDVFLSKDNEEISLKEIKKVFSNKNCPVLKGKPKIFFLNYCREDHLECDKRKLNGKAAEGLVDMTLVHAVDNGYKALRARDSGTYLVQSLCEVLNDNNNSKEFRKVIIKLCEIMKAKPRGTTPVEIDHIFKKFFF